MQVFAVPEEASEVMQNARLTPVRKQDHVMKTLLQELLQAQTVIFVAYNTVTINKPTI